MTGTPPPAGLAGRIEAAISRGLSFAQADPDSVIPESVAAVLAVVQPELDRRDAEIDRLRAELATARDRAFTEAAEMLATDTTVMNEPGDQYALAYAELLLAARDTTS